MTNEIEELLKNEFNPCKKDKYIPILEEKLSSFFEVKNAIVVSNGTAAIHLALASLNIGKGDEVLVPATAVVMSILPVLYQGATPIFVDCNKENIDFDYEDLERKISKKTKAIIPVYLWGCSYDIDKLQRFAKQHGISIIEDACQAFGSKWDNKFLGTYGTFGCFSMKNGKILATGEGGFIVTDNDELADRCRLLRNHCTNIQNPAKSFTEISWNYRITEMQALVGISNLKEIENKLKIRKKQTQYLYENLCKEHQLEVYKYYDKEESNYFSPVFIARGKKKGIQIAKQLSANGIVNSTGTFGLMPANKRKVFQNYCKGLAENDRMNTPNSEMLFEEVIALSIMENTNFDELDAIIKNIRNML